MLGLSLGLRSNTVSFTPVKLSPCLWLKAEASSVNDVGSGKVSIWSDKSGNGNNATQSTDANRPVYSADIGDGKPGLLFDATNDIMDVVSSASLDGNGAELTVAMVIKATPADFLYTLRKWAGAGNDGFIIQKDGNEDGICSVYVNGGSQQTLTPRPQIFDNVTVSLIWTINNGTMNAYVNGNQTTTNQSYTHGTGFGSSGVDMSIFDRFNGHARELILINRELDSNEIDLLNTYFSDNWDI